MSKVSRDIILRLVLKHKKAFYALLDYVSIHGGVAEIPQGLYLQQYNNVIVASGDQHAIRVLSLDSLYKNGIIVHLDMQSSTLTLQSFLVEMLRFIDTTRIRELSEADFENMRLQFQDLCGKFETEFITQPGQEDYDEFRITLFELIDTTLSKIQQNVEGLTANVNRLANRYDELDADGHNTIASRKLLEDAVTLYERFIKPCHEFLSPSIGMRDGQRTFTNAMERLAELHDKRGHPGIGMRIQYKLTAIRSYYKDIAELERRVQRYSMSLAEERKRYKVIEAVYNELLDAVADLRHGKLRGRKLHANADIFAGNRYLMGLRKLHSPHDSRLNWYDVANRVRLDEWVSSIESTSPNDPSGDLSPLPKVTDIAKERREKILKLCLQRNWPTKMDDVVSELNRWLSNELDDFSLVDTLVAYQCSMSLPLIKKNILFSRERRRVDDGNYYFEYLTARLEPEKPVLIEEHHVGN